MRHELFDFARPCTETFWVCRLAEASLRHTVSELQQRCADYELTLARREKELHDLEQRKAEEADMEYQKSRQMIDRCARLTVLCV